MPAPSQASVPAKAAAQSDVKDAPTESDNAPANAVSIASKKEAPPETAESIRLRIWVIVSFWATIIFIGLPIWWKTTTIHRESLPLDQMMDWADGRVRTASGFFASTSLIFIGLPTSLPIENINRGGILTGS